MSSEAIYFIFLTLLTPLKELLMSAALVAICAVAPPTIIAGAGFTTGGVAAGSAAAGFQAYMGNVAEGSTFAVLQTLGTVPLTTAGIGAALGAAGLAVGHAAAVAPAVVGSLTGVAIKAVAVALACP